MGQGVNPVDAAIAAGPASELYRRQRDHLGESVLILEGQLERALAHHDTSHIRHRLRQLRQDLERLLAAPPASGPLVIVPCGGKKADHSARAGQMYLGSYHRACRAAAERMGARRVLILSALYGLLELDTWIDPYDLRMGNPGSVTVHVVRHQAYELGELEATDVTVLAGAAYRKVAQQVWPHAATPLDGVGGIGKQLAVLNRLTAAGQHQLQNQ